MEKAEFRNASRGNVGVIVTEAGEKPRGIAVGPGETIWLTEEEQVLTANAPRKPENNPFANGSLVLVTEPQDIVNRRPIGHTAGNQPTVSPEEQARVDAKKAEDAEAQQRMAEEAREREEAAKQAAEDAAAKAPKPLPHQQERGVEVEPVGDAPEGERASTEEVGTPEAEAQPAPKPKPKVKAS